MQKGFPEQTVRKPAPLFHLRGRVFAITRSPRDPAYWADVADDLLSTTAVTPRAHVRPAARREPQESRHVSYCWCPQNRGRRHLELITLLLCETCPNPHKPAHPVGMSPGSCHTAACRGASGCPEPSLPGTVRPAPNTSERPRCDAVVASCLFRTFGFILSSLPHVPGCWFVPCPLPRLAS